MFKIVKKSKTCAARLGRLTTAHAAVATPVFMPVGTKGVLKYISSADLRVLGSQIMLSNTYHLMLRPGADYLKKMGGLHRFNDWRGAILTDSGGFQVFSLARNDRDGNERLVKLSERGVEFRSYLDGSKHFLSPESCLDLQCNFGVDIAVCLDECVALPAERDYIAQSVELTSRWAERAKQHHRRLKSDKPLLFAVVQGGLEKDLRLKSLRDLSAMDFDGYNIGGLSVGETPQEMYEVLDYLLPEMPADKPRYLMGVGYPENIVEAVKRGVDMFDCVIPTREGRHGRLFVWRPGSQQALIAALSGKKVERSKLYQVINVKNAAVAKDRSPINSLSKFPELTNLSKAYLHYLFKVEEPLGSRLAALHNLEFYLELMEKIRRILKNP